MAFNRELVRGILVRCEGVDPKIAARVKEFYIPKIEKTPPTVMQYMDYLKNDFIALAQDPRHPIGGGVYDDWKPEEIAEMYYVLFGERLQDWIIGKHMGEQSKH